MKTPPRDNPFDHALAEIGARLPSYFRRRVRDGSIAEDLTQETLLKACRARGALRDLTRIGPWLYRIAHGTLVDYYRTKATLGLIVADPPREISSENERVIAAITCSARCYLETLPAIYRDPVHLADYEGVPHGEVARRLGLSLAATKARVRRGKLMVRKLMEARCRFEYDARGHVIGYQLRSCEIGCGRS